VSLPSAAREWCSVTRGTRGVQFDGNVVSLRAQMLGQRQRLNHVSDFQPSENYVSCVRILRVEPQFPIVFNSSVRRNHPKNTKRSPTPTSLMRCSDFSSICLETCIRSIRRCCWAPHEGLDQDVQVHLTNVG
jgi:hypothetical protein